MAESRIYRAKSIQEIQQILKASKGAVPVAGATTFSIYCDDGAINIGSEILALNDVAQLKHIHKNDRYIDFGSCVTLNEVILRGRQNVPKVLYDALNVVGNMAIRSVATIGGNIAMKNPFTASYLPLLALDAQCELCTEKEVFWLPVSKYLSNDLENDRHVLLRIRIKDEQWTYNVYRKVKNGQYMEEIPIFLFLAKMQKNNVLDVRLLFADKKLIRQKEFDNLLLGLSLPIKDENLSDIISKAHEIFPNEEFSSSFNKQCFFNLLEKSLYNM